MPIFTLGYVYELDDFSTSGGNITPPNEQGARAQGNPPFNIQLNNGAGPLSLQIEDDDPNFQETGGADSSQLLAQDATIDGVTYPAGSHVVLNYELVDDNGFTGYSITILPTGGNTGNNVTTAFITTAPMTPGQTYTFTQENNIGGGAGRPYAQFVCFTTGSLIETSEGMQRIEALRPGTLVSTRDDGLQPLVWIGQRTVPGIGAMAPVTIRKGTLGATRDTQLSPQHRVLLEGAAPELICGAPEVLVAACHLVNGDTIGQRATGFVTYVHIALARHALVRVDGVWSETLRVGPAGLAPLDGAQRAELARMFPHPPETAPMALVRPQAKRHEARLMRWDAGASGQISSPAMNTAAAAPRS